MLQKVVKIVGVLAIIAIAVVVWFGQRGIANQNKKVADSLSVVTNQMNKASESKLQDEIDSNSYQAVFLDNGQVYFGKLQGLNDKYFSLTDVFYLKDANGKDIATGGSANMQLVKLGNEVHGPKDDMYIPADKIEFIENLKNSGQVVTSIKRYEAAH